MNEFFTEDDYDVDYSNDEDKPELEIFHDPFFEIGPYLKQDESINNHPNFEELVFFLKSAWLDPYFYRNRTLCSFSTYEYLPEEKGLLILIKKLLELADDESLDHYLLTLFCMITGRCSELLKFDPVTSSNINTVNFRAPFQLYSSPGEGPCCLSPYLIILSIHETVSFPSIVTYYENHEMKDDGSIEVKKEVTTDLQKSFEFALREPPKVFPLSFDYGLTLTNVVQRFPTSDGGFWVRITCEPFSIAYGSDISNGRGKVQYPWVNRFSGSQPPTLSEDGYHPLVEWTDEPIFKTSILDFFKDIDIKNYCPLSCPNPDQVFRDNISGLHPEVKEYITIWADPHTGRIKDSDMKYLSMTEDKKTLIIAECNDKCECHNHQCPCRITSRPSFEGLMLFYSPDKDWGVVATQDIEAGVMITTYAGEQKLEGENIEDRNHVYHFGLEFGDNDTKCSYHALKKCNIGRFINQTHGTLGEYETPFSQPNATARKISSPFVEMGVIGIFSIRKIFKGEEINISYGEHYQMKRKCACNYCLCDENSYKDMLANINTRVEQSVI